MNRQQRRKMERSTAKTYLQLLSELGGAPKIAVVENIYFFYKADLLTQGFEGSTGSIDEADAEQFYKRFVALDADFRNSSPSIRNIKTIDYLSHLNNWQVFINADPNNLLKLFSYLWLLEKVGVIPNDNFNGVVFRSVRI